MLISIICCFAIDSSSGYIFGILFLVVTNVTQSKHSRTLFSGNRFLVLFIIICIISLILAHFFNYDGLIDTENTKYIKNLEQFFVLTLIVGTLCRLKNNRYKKIYNIFYRIVIYTSFLPGCKLFNM